MTRLRSTAALLALLGVLAGATGCVSLPEDGPVVETGARSGDAQEAGEYYFDPPPPPDGASPAEVVDRFLDAMTAFPITTSVARQYLTPDFQESWSPKDGIITYDDFLPPRGSSRVSVSLVGAARLDGTGRWRGPLPAYDEILSFPVELVDEQYRIASAPDALVVPQSWFEQRYQRVALYFFDPNARVLVPEPAFVPRGDQLVSNLVSALLGGPGPELSRVATTFLPAGSSVELSVPVGDVVDIAIDASGSAPAPTDEAVRLIVAQLAWTLRQVPTIERFRVSIDGRPVQLPGGVTEFGVDEGAEYDPAGYQATGRLYGLRDGLLVSGAPDALDPTDGPFGTRDAGIRSFAVDLSGTTAAAVTASGGSVLRAPVRGVEETTMPLVSGATDLLPPAWDVSGRLWLVDRTPQGARVSTVTGDEDPVALRVPGISGSDVRSFIVSRDGSRVVAVVRTSSGDQVRVSRVRYDQNRLLSASASQRLRWDGGEDVRVRDLGWRSPTSVAVLHRLADELFEVRTLSVDGAPAGAESAATTLRGRYVGLAGTPVASGTVWAVTRTGLVDVSSQNRDVVALPAGVAAVRYVG
ncbi:LpqB family beta-propeller domain-containing protein [Nocardioides sp. SOB77]|uniref:LpqB family beta-propeller domain-containing protein n=1 Tax=Nocardioides oceani TaxID=3058369 RepID=A0ABT8FKG5_9ACTN|nr:LpqB family beta-propeller domain-containing protein [Nocardioides oceani]MDN4174995.1 LpqB family beta-propeller domain-containing protein [Nocardioides oceani]